MREVYALIRPGEKVTGRTKLRSAQGLVAAARYAEGRIVVVFNVEETGETFPCVNVSEILKARKRNARLTKEV
jgi:hypothetical protein